VIETRCGVSMLGLLALPIVSVVVPPLVDYPNHLARMHILVQAIATAGPTREPARRLRVTARPKILNFRTFHGPGERC
jgi:hypothetical protein